VYEKIDGILQRFWQVEHLPLVACIPINVMEATAVDNYWESTNANRKPDGRYFVSQTPAPRLGEVQRTAVRSTILTNIHSREQGLTYGTSTSRGGKHIYGRRLLLRLCMGL